MNETLKVLLNSIFSFSYLFIIANLLGKKQVAQLTVVDYVVGISIGNFGAEWCTNGEYPWYHYLIGMTVYAMLSLIIDYLERKIPFKDILKGTELELMCDGKINFKNLKKSKMDVNTLLALCREKDYFDLNAIAYIFFENTGKISILPKGNERPLVANDLVKLKITKSSPSSYLILDGNIVKDDLYNLGKDEKWLYEKCGITCKKDLKNIILAQYLPETNSFNIHYKKKKSNIYFYKFIFYKN